MGGRVFSKAADAFRKTRHFSTQAAFVTAQRTPLPPDASTSQQARSRLPLWAKAGIFGAASVAGWIAVSEDSQRSARIAFYVPQRVFRDVVTASSIAYGGHFCAACARNQHNCARTKRILHLATKQMVV